LKNFNALKKNFLKDEGYKWFLVMLLLVALMIAVMIYYNRRIKIINDKLKETAETVCSKQ
jgi:hypothetical protein